jgi:hypothetical protein
MKIPLIPDKFFKDYPSGKDFALWLANIYTGEVPPITIRQRKPTYDEVIKAFNEAGIIVSYSSGTGGRYTFIPRNKNCIYSVLSMNQKPATFEIRETRDSRESAPSTAQAPVCHAFRDHQQPGYFLP